MLVPLALARQMAYFGFGTLASSLMRLEPSSGDSTLAPISRQSLPLVSSECAELLCEISGPAKLCQFIQSTEPQTQPGSPESEIYFLRALQRHPNKLQQIFTLRANWQWASEAKVTVLVNVRSQLVYQLPRIDANTGGRKRETCGLYRPRACP